MLEHLPERDRPAVKRRLRRAWADTDHQRALDALRLLAAELDRSHPGAAASLREGMEETLTLTRLGIRGSLKRTLESTNACESMIECVRRSARNVKRWQSGDMALRWTAAGMLEAERQFRRIIGYRDLAKLSVAIERDLDRHRQPMTDPTPTEEAARRDRLTITPGPPPRSSTTSGTSSLRRHWEARRGARAAGDSSVSCASGTSAGHRLPRPESIERKRAEEHVQGL